VETNETPQALKNNFFGTHVGHGVNQADTVESKLDQVALVCNWVQVVTGKRFSVLGFLNVWIQEKRVGGLNVIVDQITWKDTSLSLWKIEAWELILHALWVSLRIINVEDTSSKSRSHFSSVVSVHS